jgi:hypothetical protein
MKKLFSLLLVLSLFFCLGLVSLAEEPSDATDPPSEEVVTPPAEEITPPPTEEAETEAASFALVDWFYAHIDKLFSGSCLAVSLILAYCFRKKLLPTVACFVTDIMKTVTDIKQGASESALMQNEDVKAFFDKVSPVLDDVHKNADACKKALEIAEQSETEREAMIVAMQEMSAIILSMIEASRLPESVKEKARIGEINTKKLVDSLRASKEAEIPSVSATQP